MVVISREWKCCRPVSPSPTAHVNCSIKFAHSGVHSGVRNNIWSQMLLHLVTDVVTSGHRCCVHIFITKERIWTIGGKSSRRTWGLNWIFLSFASIISCYALLSLLIIFEHKNGTLSIRDIIEQHRCLSPQKFDEYSVSQNFIDAQKCRNDCWCNPSIVFVMSLHKSYGVMFFSCCCTWWIK